jgi:ABC-3C biological conflict system middle component
MLRPTKHSHPDRTVLSLALVLLGRLRAKRVENYDELRAFSRAKVDGGHVLFLPALSFLYVMGVVEYRPKNDSFEYVGPNAAI